MVYVRIESNRGSLYEASYMPNDATAAPGRIALDSETKERALLAKSPDDAMPNSWFVGHAFAELERMVSQTPVKKSSSVAWW